MIATSAAYKEQIDANTSQVKMRVTIDYSDYNIDNSTTSTVTTSDRLSDDDQMADGIESPTFAWQSWGNFQWGRHLRSENHTQYEKGALSARISESDNTFVQRIGRIAGGAVAGGTVANTFTDYPKFRINFTQRTVNSLKVIFDDKLQEYAVDFDVNVYTDDYETPEHTENITGNTSVRWEAAITQVLLATSVEVIVYEWNLPRCKAKIIESFTSLQQEYLADKIDAISLYEETEADSGSPIGNITSNTINVTLVNIDSEFDNDNDLSVLANNITKNRRITAYFTLNELTDDEIELGSFYSDEWAVNNNSMSAEVSGKDLFQLMAEQEYTTNQFISPGIDQNFTYTTTAEFAAFTLDNVKAINNELQFGGAALLCGSSLFSTHVAGGSAVVPFLSTGSTYCGTAEKTISYNYTPGTSVTISASYNAVIPTGANILLYVNYRNDEYELFTDVITFTPGDITDTTQQVNIRIFFMTQSTTATFSVQDISFTFSEEVTLYALAAKLLYEFDEVTQLLNGKYIIDQFYSDLIIPLAFFEPQSYKEVLRQICEAGAGRAYQRRDGYIIVESFRDITTASKIYTDSNAFDIQKITKPSTIFNRATVIINQYVQVASPEKVGDVDIVLEDGEALYYTIKFDKVPCDTVTYSGLPSGVTVTDETVYTWGVYIEITNASGSNQDFTLEVNAKPYEINGNRYYQLDNTESIRKNGVIELVIDNHLIQTETQAITISTELIEKYSIQLQDVELQVIPDPSIELGDTIKVNDDFYIMKRTELNYSPGELTQLIGGRK